MFISGPPEAPGVGHALEPPGPTLRGDLPLARAVHRTFVGPAEFTREPANRARTAQYVMDLATAYGRKMPAQYGGEEPSAGAGQSYAEMAQALISSVVTADEPVDLLVLAFSLHDVRPGQQTAAYLNDVAPGAPLAFAICDQGSAAAFSGLRIAREYAASAGVRRVLLIVVEQAMLPYDCPIPLPRQHRGVAMLYGDGAPAPAGGLAERGSALARTVGVRQQPGVQSGDVAGLAAAELSDLAAGYGEVSLVLSDSLAAVWTAPAAARVRVVTPGQPATGVWSELIAELERGAELVRGAGAPDLVVAADYDPELRYLCLAGFATAPRSA